MKKMTMMAGAAALAFVATTAQAAPTITSPATLPLVNLGTGNGMGYQLGATATLLLTPGVTTTPFAFGATGSGVYSGTGKTGSFGYTSPFASGNQNYIALQPGSSITYTFSSPQTMFGLLFGTIDSYNNISFVLSGGGSYSYTGTQIATALGLSANGASTANTLVTFSGEAFTAVTLSDNTSSAFEFVPASFSAVPEPAAWGMMILGFGLVGGALRRRATNVKVRYV